MQRAGAEGFSHNEINSGDTHNRMIQLWFEPERPEDSAGYKVYKPVQGEITRAYGGNVEQSETFDSHTLLDVALLNPGQNIDITKPFLAYLTVGEGVVNRESVKCGDLFKDESLQFQAKSNVQLFVAYLNE